MNRYIIYIFTVFILACENEETYEIGDTYIKFFQTEGMEQGVDFLIDDNGILLLGNTDNATLNSSMLLIYTDLEGNEIWQQNLEAGDNEGKEITDNAVGIAKLNNGELVILGNRQEDGVNKGLLIKVNLSNPESFTYKEVTPTTVTVNQVHFNDIEATSDDGFIIIGEVRNFENVDTSIPNSDWNMISIKYDVGMNLSLERVNGFLNNSDDFGNSIVEGPNQNYYLFGSVTVEKVINGNSEFISDVRTVRVNSFLDPVWDKKPESNFNDYGKKILNYANTRFVLGEQHKSETNSNILVTELDDNGNPGSIYFFGSEKEETAGDMYVTPEGIFITGASNFGNNTFDIYIMKITPNGELLWEKRFGFEGDDYGEKIYVQSNGDILVVGSAIFGNLSKICLIKTDKDGNLSKLVDNSEKE
ncbi:hypothetical protein [Flammeovirga pacifica]|nr:hypothetical protein [Flammeovirga pacifica]